MGQVTIITCTKDRPVELNTLLNSISNQVSKPDLHIIVDGSDEPAPVKEVVDKFSHLPIKYVTLRPPGLTRQKNYGISLLPESSEWVGILDDDVVLDPNTIQNLRKYIEENKETKGIGLVFKNFPSRGTSFVRNLLLIDGKNDGGFTASGLPNSIHDHSKSINVEWLHGGATFWSKNVLEEYKFDEWFSGVGYFEDIDFSYRVSRKYPLAILSEAKCVTDDRPIPKEKLFRVGTWQIVSWWYFVSKTKSFNKILVIYSMLGALLTNLVVGIVKPSSHRLRNAFGNLYGAWIILSGKTNKHVGFQK